MTLPQGVCWRGKAWISPGLGIFLGHTGSHDWHSHMAHQISISLNASLPVKCPSSSLTARAICIRAGPGLLVLFARGTPSALVATWFGILMVHLAFQHSNLDYSLG